MDWAGIVNAHKFETRVAVILEVTVTFFIPFTIKSI